MPKSKPSRRRATLKPEASRQHEVLVRARRLDLIADLELQHGHAAAAETLAWRAAALREEGRPR